MISPCYEKCTGCGACVQACPEHCIEWVNGDFDFCYPKVNVDKCINCHLCERVCPIGMDVVESKDQKVFAGVCRDSQILCDSTSGGAFSVIARAIIQKKGVVYGAAMLENFVVAHIRVDNEQDLSKLRGSKYVQSDTNYTFVQVKKDLELGKYVLYSGTPCQIAGLKVFLDREYEKLYTVDIVCHGVGSQAYFSKYLTYAKKRYGHLSKLMFRNKKFVGWSCGGGVIVDSSLKEKPYREYEHYYYAYFLMGSIYRMSCYTCKYANMDRQGDFTIGDYWGIESLRISLNTRNGCSLIIVNSKKGMAIFKNLTDIKWVETTIEQAKRCNRQLNFPSQLTSSRVERINEYGMLSGEEIQGKYVKFNRRYILIGKMKAILPRRLKYFMRRYL